MIISLDPSSSCTGYALWSPEFQLIECDRWVGDRKHHSATRIRRMVGEFMAMAREHKVERIIVERPDDKPGWQGRNAYQAQYGMAVGAFMGCGIALGIPVTTVTPDKWGMTQGPGKPKRVPKRDRALWMQHQHGPVYLMRMDTKDFDIADAVGVGDWVIENHLKRAVSDG